MLQETDLRVKDKACDFGCHQNYLEVEEGAAYDPEVSVAEQKASGLLTPASRRPCNSDSIIFPRVRVTTCLILANYLLLY